MIQSKAAVANNHRMILTIVKFDPLSCASLQQGQYKLYYTQVKSIL